MFVASFTHKGKTINAFRFKEDEKFVDYFDSSGNNLRSAFLMSPVDFARVSSVLGTSILFLVNGKNIMGLIMKRELQ